MPDWRVAVAANLTMWLVLAIGFPTVVWVVWTFFWGTVYPAGPTWFIAPSWIVFAPAVALLAAIAAYLDRADDLLP